MIDERTASLDLPLPHPSNMLSEDVERIRSALTTIDSAVMAPATTHSAGIKPAPVDADEIPLVDSAESFGLKRLTWANLKLSVKAFFDSIYAPISTGVTGGDAHDHSGGDGAQIAYSSLGGIPATFSPSAHGHTGLAGSVTALIASATLTSNTAYSYSAAGLTLTLPAAPAVGDVVLIFNIGDKVDCVIARNGKTIMGLAENMTINIKYTSCALKYVGGNDWRLQ